MDVEYLPAFHSQTTLINKKLADTIKSFRRCFAGQDRFPAGNSPLPPAMCRHDAGGLKRNIGLEKICKQFWLYFEQVCWWPQASLLLTTYVSHVHFSRVLSDRCRDRATRCLELCASVQALASTGWFQRKCLKRPHFWIWHSVPIFGFHLYHYQTSTTSDVL